MKKYNINKEIKILRFFKFSIFKWIIPIYNLFLSIISNNKHTDKNVIVRKIKVKSINGKKIKVYEFIPKKSCNTTSSMLYFHGGAFYLKATFYHYSLAKKYATLGNKKVFFVEYRLSLKNKYPTAVWDAYYSYLFLLENSEKLNIDPHDIGVGGDSAGGNIAISLSIFLKENGFALPKYQLLVYPVIDDIVTQSKIEFVDTPMWNSKLNRKMWKYYLLDKSIYKSPFDNFVNIRTYIEVTEYDCLKDEGIKYYEYLKENNISVYLNETLGTVHGYDILLNTQLAKENIKKRIDFIKNTK